MILIIACLECMIRYFVSKIGIQVVIFNLLFAVSFRIATVVLNSSKWKNDSLGLGHFDCKYMH